MTRKLIAGRLKTYLDFCNQNPNRDMSINDTLVRHMYDTVSLVMSKRGPEFIDAWAELLIFFQDNINGPANEKLVLAGADRLRQSIERVEAFGMVIALLHRTYDPSIRANGVATFPWRRFSAYWPEAGELVRAYYAQVK